MTPELALFLFISISIVSWITLSLPAKEAPKEEKKGIKCPRCGTQNERLCPNCSAPLPEGLDCKKCKLTAAKIPCKICSTDLKGMSA